MSGLSRLLAGITTALLLWLSLSVGVARAEGEYITLASTTSTENSGLLAYLLPKFREVSGIDVRVVAVGTGKALRLAEAGDADVLLVHDRESEDRFVAAGYGVERVDVMYNDFVLLGPASDPTGVKGDDVVEGFGRVAASGQPFASRADDSGTHKAEMRLWALVGVDPRPHSGQWYLETGSGMGKTLNVASEKQAYVLSDRATWISFRNKGELELLVEGDPRLFNPYGAILVNPERHPHVKAAAGRKFLAWLVSDDGRQAIEDFRVDGEVLFHPSLH